MWRVHLAGEDDRKRYDAFVRGSDRGHPLQLWSWGEVKAGDGWTPLRLLVEERGHPRAAAGLVEKRLLGRLRFWMCHRGPVCEPGSAAAERLWRGLRELALRRGALALRCDPEWPQPEARFLRSARLRPLPPRPSWYFGAMEPLRAWRIRLDGGEAAVFARFEAQTRYDVRRSQRTGVAVRPGTRADLPDFHRLLRATAVRKGFVLRAPEFFERLWRAWDEGLFVAEHAGAVVGGLWVARCGGGTWAQFAAVGPEGRRLLASAGLHWAAIRWAIARGCRFFDLGGIGYRDDPHDGLRAFKKGFGPGDVRFAGEHDLVLRPAAYRAFRLAEEARWNGYYGLRRRAAGTRPL